MEACQWLAARGCPRPRDAVAAAAAASGDRDLYEWFLSRADGFKCTAQAMEAAAAAGHESLAHRIRSTVSTKHVRESYLVAVASGCRL
ncbi:hypothetical protein GPECTOR_169g181 [Gonium pectorale]|uniref:Uncharacterized protein n=1 Tax=Gonium pectorale TaxID=33097 RepID=A0A150FXH2_GONPE|nr:hypothetical protein GPECTOR_169g181 [Gonium pectorale]|eukprot:KXZ42277.1 hypothetical protein GPECTOR_169g181 [Gonium pectorale]